MNGVNKGQLTRVLVLIAMKYGPYSELNGVPMALVPSLHIYTEKVF